MALALTACGTKPPVASLPVAGAPTAVPTPPAPKLVLNAARFADLPGWTSDRQNEALGALILSCDRIARGVAERGLDGFAFAGTAADWAGVCQQAKTLPRNDAQTVRTWFESEFRALRVSDNDQSEGLMTGYYEPVIKASRRKSARFNVPIHAAPRDLVSVDLGQFRENLKGQRIAGRVVGRDLKPYDDREKIEAGSLANQNLEILWADDPVDVFFLHIQGSGRVELDDGKTVRIGYAAQNGHPYVAIGRLLIDRGVMTREDVSMQSLRAWLNANPKDGSALMRQNPSYVFFRETSADVAANSGPLGAMGVALTPGRSIAVDRSLWPLGLPIWIDATEPALQPDRPDRPLQRLMVAQDTGGAIRGVIRGDVFYGHGPEASEISGRMKNPARWWVLLPRAVAARVVPNS